MKIVITGGSGSGKTTLINELAARGYKTVPEAAIQIIESLVNLIGTGALRQWRSEEPVAFQKLIWAKIVALESTIPPSSEDIWFLDRGLLDGLAYNSASAPGLMDHFNAVYRSQVHYDKAFVLDTLSDFDERKSTGRTSTHHESDSVGAKISATYQSHGIPVWRIPEASVEQRCDWLLSKIHGNQKSFKYETNLYISIKQRLSEIRRGLLDIFHNEAPSLERGFQDHALPIRIFIGSSTEALGSAKELKKAIEQQANSATALSKGRHLQNVEVKSWPDETLQPSSSTLEALISIPDNYDFGLFVFEKDDLTISRGQINISPRDNVVFELGLFMGKLGRSRSIFCIAEGHNIKIPSDLAGINFISLTQGNYPSLPVGPDMTARDAASQVLLQVRKTGRRALHKKWLNIDEAHDYLYSLMKCPTVRSIHMAAMTKHVYPVSGGRQEFNANLVAFAKKHGYGGIWYVYLDDKEHHDSRTKRADDLTALTGFENKQIRFVEPSVINDASIPSFIIIGEEEVVEFVDRKNEPSYVLLHAGAAIRKTFKTLFDLIWELGKDYPSKARK